MNAEHQTSLPAVLHATPRMRVLITDDHALWRDGVRSILEESDFEVVGEAESGPEAVQLVRALHRKGLAPHLVLMDIRMAGGDGLDALGTIKREFATIGVIMLTTYENPSYLARAVAGGAAGYLLKGIKRAELLEALRTVARGESLLSDEELERALQDVPRHTASLPETLSEREIEVLKLLSQGLSNRQIGATLFVSENTIKTHVVNIISKIGVSDRVQAAVWAVRHGLV